MSLQPSLTQLEELRVANKIRLINQLLALYGRQGVCAISGLKVSYN